MTELPFPLNLLDGSSGLWLHKAYKSSEHISMQLFNNTTVIKCLKLS